MRTFRALVIAAAAVITAPLAPSSARAQPSGPDVGPDAAPNTGAPHVTTLSERRWFGYEIMLMDAVALGAGLLIGAQNEGSDRQETGDVIASTWGLGMVGSYALHSAHENSALGLAGMGARLLLPPIGAVLGVAAHCLAVAGEDPCSAPGGRGGFVVGMVGASLLDTFAFARAEVDDPSEAIEGERVWYGLPTLVIDGAALATGFVLAFGRTGSRDRSETGAALLGMPYLVGLLVSPWVHAFNGRVGVAFASLALRALGPAVATVGGIAGFCAASGSERRCTKEGAIWGLFGGTLLVAAIDIGGLSFKRERPEDSASIVPYVVPTPDGRGLSAGFTGAL